MERWIVRAAILFVCLNALIAQGQQRADRKDPWLYVGGFLGYNNNLHSAAFSYFPDYVGCSPGFENGTGGSFNGGLLAALPLFKSVQLETRLGYTSLGGRLYKVESDPFYIIDLNDPNAEPTGVEIGHTIQADLPGIYLEPSLNFQFFSKLRTSIGYRLMMMMSGTFTQQEEINSPSTVTYKASGSRIRNQYSNVKIPELNTLQQHVSFGIGFDFPTSLHSTLTPELRYFLPLSAISNQVDWEVSSISFGVSFRYGLMPAPEPRFIIDTLYKRDTTTKTIAGLQQARMKMESSKISLEEKKENDGERDVITKTTVIEEKYIQEVPKVSKLLVSVEAFGLAKNGTRNKITNFTIEETEFEENYPLLPQIFFPEGISELSASGQNLIKTEETNDFSEFQLPRKTLEVYKDILNIIGARMRNNPLAKVTLIGCNSNTNVEKGNRQLSTDRANAVKRYLVDTWGIDQNRLQVRSQNLPSSPANNTTEDGQAENRRVELVSDNFEILKNVSVKDVTIDANPPVVELVPKVEAEEGIAEWNAKVVQDGNVLRSFNGKESLPTSTRWEVTTKPYPKSESPLRVTYNVKDGVGQLKEGSAELKVQQLTLKKKRFEQQDDKKIERFSLIVFDFNKADLNPDNKRIIAEVKSRIQADSKVTIAGYADKSGDPEYNRELARKRCVEVQKSIGLDDTNSVIQANGSDVLLFDNSTPEGRAYSRTVQIVIETPVKQAE